MESVDVVVIGAGAGGGASAWALTEQGIRVLVLEAGPAYDPAKDYKLQEPNWEQFRFPDKAHRAAPYSFGDMQKLDPKLDDLRSWNHVTGRKNPSEHRVGSKYHHTRGVGGTTLRFTGEAHRLNPAAMKMYSRFGVAADWPVSYQELEPHYVTAERMIGVAGSPDDPRRPRSTPYRLPAHDPGYASRRIMAGARSLGLRFVPNPLAVLSRPYDGRPSCNYCANCLRGCPRTDKGSVDVTFIRKALNSGRCTIRTQTQVTALHAGPDDRVRSVEYLDASGNRQRVLPRMVIVACGAVETPRLLLLSAGPHAPDGLANETGQVGRNLMETVSWISSGLNDEMLGSYRGLPSDIICWDYNEPDSIPGVVGGCRFSPGTAEANLVGPINHAWRMVKGWGKAHKQSMRETFGRALSVGAIGESLPNPRTCVDLDPDRYDELGQPIARIHSYVAEQEVQRLQFMAKTVRDILHASGVRDIVEEMGTYDLFNASHIFGTARMGDDPEVSVVDRNCRSHRWKNLYIVDASVFPSSGGGESPSLTIEALAIRTAEHIGKGFLQRG